MKCTGTPAPSPTTDIRSAVSTSIPLESDFYTLAGGEEGVWLLSPTDLVIHDDTAWIATDGRTLLRVDVAG